MLALGLQSMSGFLSRLWTSEGLKAQISAAIAVLFHASNGRGSDCWTCETMPSRRELRAAPIGSYRIL